jgi:hypothetical protein
MSRKSCPQYSEGPWKYRLDGQSRGTLGSRELGHETLFRTLEQHPDAIPRGPPRGDREDDGRGGKHSAYSPIDGTSGERMFVKSVVLVLRTSYRV